MSRPTILVNGEPLAGPLPLFQRWGRDGVRDGRKTQTRRLRGLHEINEHPGQWTFDEIDSVSVSEVYGVFRNPAFPERYGVRCRYGLGGQVRYLREPLLRTGWTLPCPAPQPRDFAVYDDDETVAYKNGKVGAPIYWRWKRNTLSSMFMPREAARTFVRLLPPRCERVQDISDGDARAEGVRGDIAACITVRAEFAAVWDRIHGEGAWGRNDWVFVPAWELLDSPTVEVQS